MNSLMIFFVSLFLVPSEIPVLRKERFNNWYQLRTYYASILVINVPQQVIYAVVHTSISYYLTSQPLEIWRFFMFITTCSFVTIIAEAVGTLLGTLVDPVVSN